MNIICVDDEPLVLDLTVGLCRDLPQQPTVMGFSKAGDALEWVERNTADIALLDINMPDMDGMTLAARIKEHSPFTAIIFLTGYSQYAVDAFALHASGYLLKPVSRERLNDEIAYAMEMRRRWIARPDSVHILVRTFGEFELYVDRKAVSFPRSKAKELLAYLVDRQGGTYDRSMQKQLDVIIRSLRATLDEAGASEMLEMDKGLLRVVPERFDCDLYRFFAGDAETVNAYRGEYMNSYSWASLTEAYLDRKNAK